MSSVKDKRTNYEYGFRPSVLPGESFQTFVRLTPYDNTAVQKHSEFKKPYATGIKSYQQMEYQNDLSPFYMPGSLTDVPLDIFEEPEAVGCGGASIGYTTQQMAVNESQTLTVISPQDGAVYSWEVSNGGGSVTSGGIYTAPATNPECANNPTIALIANGNVCDTLLIAVNAIAGLNVVEFFTDTDTACVPLTADSCHCTRDCDFYNCDGTLNASSTCNAGFEGVQLLCTASYPPRVCETGCTPIVSTDDRRSALQITSGCCPYQLL